MQTKKKVMYTAYPGGRICPDAEEAAEDAAAGISRNGTVTAAAIGRES